MAPRPFDVLIHNTSEVITCDGELRGDAERALAPVPRGAVGIRGSLVAWIGTEVPADCVTNSTIQIDAKGGFVGPGLVDCHTHVVFAGSRAEEFEARCRGKTDLEVAQAGGGIQTTVSATRAATENELAALAHPRLSRLLRHGVTTVEVKSGYGLDVETELRMLRVIRRLGTEQAISLVPTLLGLHSLPPEFAFDREAYLRRFVDELLPRVQSDALATFCDAFVEQTAFSHAEAEFALREARRRGLKLRLHVDQLTANQGAQLAARLGAVSADHLEQIDDAGIAALAQAGTIAVLAPISTLFAKVKPYAPGRALIDAGVRVALCTNCNPGSSMTENVFLAMGLACVENGLTPAEAFLGFTRFGALALDEPALGRLGVGGPADAVVFDAESYRSLPYHFGMNDVSCVIKAGRVV
jgi:imidazolonepropionase